MARRRYISTDISLDSKLNRVSDFAALLYTWGIAHARDDCRISPQNAEEVRNRVVPGRNKSVEEVEKALLELVGSGLNGIDEKGEIYYPSNSFYKYQTYINAANRRETPQNAASLSLSLSPSLKEESRSASPTPSADFSKSDKKTREEKHMTSMNLIPELKEAADRVYYSDPVKFKRIAAWIGQGRKNDFRETDMAEALRQFWDYRVIDEWYPYLDTILDKVVKDRNMRESTAEHERFKSEPIAGPILNLVKGGANAKKA